MTGACDAHPGERAVARCGRCGDRLCRACLTDWVLTDNSSVCAHCIFAAAATRTRLERIRSRFGGCPAPGLRPRPAVEQGAEPHIRTFRHRPDRPAEAADRPDRRPSNRPPRPARPARPPRPARRAA